MLESFPIMAVDIKSVVLLNEMEDHAHDNRYYREWDINVFSDGGPKYDPYYDHKCRPHNLAVIISERRRWQLDVHQQAKYDCKNQSDNHSPDTVGIA